MIQIRLTHIDYLPVPVHALARQFNRNNYPGRQQITSPLIYYV